MKFVRRNLIVLLALILALGAAVVRAQVLDQVPEQAMVVVRIANLDSFSQKFGKLATDLQLVAMVPELSDPLTSFQQKTHMSAGVNKAGDGAFVYLDPAVAGGQDDSILLLIPVSDYKAFVGNFQDTKEADGITEGKFADGPAPAFMAKWGNYAALSPHKEIVALKPAGLKLQGLAAKEVASKDAIVVANMAQLRTKVQPALAMGRDELARNLEQALAGNQQMTKFAPVLKLLASRLMDGAEAFFRDTQTATYGISFGDSGVNTTIMAEFEPTSYIGGIVKGLKNTDASMLAGLPGTKYLLYGGSINDPTTAAKLIDDLVVPLQNELKKIDGEESAAITKYVDAIKKYMTACKGQTFGMVEPTGALRQEALIQFLSIQSGDAAVLKAAYPEMLAAQQDVMKALMPAAQGAVKMTTASAEKTLDGIAFDVTHTDMPGVAGNPQAQQMMSMVYGPNGMTIATGVVADKMLIGMCTPDTTLSAAITSVKGNDDPLSKLPGVVSVSSNLPKSRLMAVYVPLDEIMTTVGTYAGAMGAPIQIQLPPDLPPVGATISSDGSALRGDSYIPTDLLKALVAQGMQIYIQAQGGMRPGGPGGL